MAQNYIILEITRNAAGNIAVYPTARESEEAAYSKYYNILSTASSTPNPEHGAVLLTHDGFFIESRCFKHEPQPEPEPEPEPEPNAE